jgi:DNA helicase-2/ATP-dependent DNA helicase PcrA
MTRAEERLYLSRAQVRLRFGEKKMNPPSQFIEEIPEELLTGTADKRSEMAEEEKLIHSDNSGTEYAIGQRIVHPRWGIGTILSIRGDKNPELKIAFEQGKTRNLLAEFAPIQKV